MDFLNEVIPDGSVKIKNTSMRVTCRLRHQCCNVDKEFKRLNSKGSKENRVVFLNKSVESKYSSQQCRYCGRNGARDKVEKPGN